MLQAKIPERVQERIAEERAIHDGRAFTIGENAKRIRELVSANNELKASKRAVEAELQSSLQMLEHQEVAALRLARMRTKTRIKTRI